MILEQIYTKSLNQTAYFIASDQEAVVIDPIRDIEEYLDLAQKHDVKIKYIFMTHLYAEMVSGHLSLAKATGASLIFGANTSANFTFNKAEDGTQFSFGNLTIQAILTPGHSVESTSFLLYDEQLNPVVLFSGNAMSLTKGFNTDLKSIKASKEELAAMFYNSVYNKIFALPESTLVLSASESKILEGLPQKEALTLGFLKESNPLFKMRNELKFMEEATKEIAEMPSAFIDTIEKNKNTYEDIDHILSTSLQPISLIEFIVLKKLGDTQILDIRGSEIFTLGFIPKSISIGLEGDFEYWVLRLLDPKKSMVLIAEDEVMVKNAIVRLARVGFENVKGFLEGGVASWADSEGDMDMIIDVEADEFALDLRFDNQMIPLDVRSLSEYDAGFLQNAQHLPLERLINPLYMTAIDEELHNYVFSAEGYRSVIACSIMKKEGFNDVRNVLGGYKEIEKQEGLVLMIPKSEEEIENDEIDQYEEDQYDEEGDI